MKKKIRPFKERQLVLSREEFLNSEIDIGGRDILMAFNEPKLRFDDHFHELFLDAKLCARLPTYFIGAVELARVQKRRPRLLIVSGINSALKWNTNNTLKEQKIMVINNKLKFDFLNSFFNKFFKDDFSIIESVVAQDMLKVKEERFESFWYLLEIQYPKEFLEVKTALIRFIGSENENMLKNSFKYAILHLFFFADANFEGEYVHNSVGYCSIGGHQEEIFNIVREIGNKILKKFGEEFFDREMIFCDNLRLVLKDEKNAPPSYNGSTKKTGRTLKLVYDEVTFENKESLKYYDLRPRLKADMDFLYEFVPREEYEKFWNEYRERYFDLKKRYCEAYEVDFKF